MKATKDQLSQQERQLKELLEHATYNLVFEDGLIEELQIQLTVFSMCMQRTIAGGFDPPSEKQMVKLSDYWYQLHDNIKVALELLSMADSTMKGLKYDIEDTDGPLQLSTLKERLDEWKKNKS